jgi:hypothetical protein
VDRVEHGSHTESETSWNLMLASDVPGVLDRYDLAEADARFQWDFGRQKRHHMFMHQIPMLTILSKSISNYREIYKYR